jgi:hypothetical protein
MLWEGENYYITFDILMMQKMNLQQQENVYKQDEIFSFI